MSNTYTNLGHEDIKKPFTINEEHLKNVLEAKAFKKDGYECLYLFGPMPHWKPYHKTIK